MAARAEKEISPELERLEAEEYSTDSYSESPPSDIISFNELRSCYELTRLATSGQLVIQPDFQRDVVWNNRDQTRFIDSLIKQLPIPSMCISLDYQTDERLVIDGLQRIHSIIEFMTNSDWKLSRLDEIDDRISGKRVRDIREQSPEILNRFENVSIPITILRCDYSKKSHMNYLFTIFHRLNTGGNKLTNQEIRNCIFRGQFNDLLKRVVSYEGTRKLFGLKTGGIYRFSYEELVLRVCAFSLNKRSYKGRLSQYLNDFMDENKNMEIDKAAGVERSLIRSVDLIHQRMLGRKKLPKLSKSTQEALLLGVFENIGLLEEQSDESLREKLQRLRRHEQFSIDSLREGVAATDKVNARHQVARDIFSQDG